MPASGRQKRVQRFSVRELTPEAKISERQILALKMEIRGLPPAFRSSDESGSVSESNGSFPVRSRGTPNHPATFVRLKEAGLRVRVRGYR